MRKALLLAALLAGMVLSGCSGDAPKEVLETGDGDDGRRSEDGSGGNGTDRPHAKVPLLDVAYEALGQSTQAFDVDVPANTTNVDAILSWPGPAHERTSFTAELTGC